VSNIAAVPLHITPAVRQFGAVLWIHEAGVVIVINSIERLIVAESGMNPEEPGVGLAAFRYIRLYPRA
jgi:hypothetical protein